MDRAQFLAIPIHAIPRADPLLHSRGEPWKLIILSAAFRQRTNPESTGERPRERTRRHRRVAPRRAAPRCILVHIKRFVPRNIEFVVYRSFPLVTGINFRLSAITRSRSHSLVEKLANHHRAPKSLRFHYKCTSDTDVFQIKIFLFPLYYDPIWYKKQYIERDLDGPENWFRKFRKVQNEIKKKKFFWYIQ